MTHKQYLDDFLNNHHSKYFAPVQFFLAFITILSIVSIILETVQDLGKFSQIFLVIELVTTTIFSIEYLCRIYIAPNKVKYILSFWGLLDLVCILPTFLDIGNLTFLKSVRSLKVLRLVRTLRIAKISRSYLEDREKAKTQADFNKLNIGIYFLALTFIVTIFGSIFYMVNDRTGVYSNIPSAMLITLKILIGGLSLALFNGDLIDDAISIIISFMGLIMLGLLISIVGGVVNQWLLGGEHEEK